ncbi:MAG: GntR family transcriptional regulator [Erysipelothrix sp.]|nr:GntR family transcriptional regulator [Erysipelothrix sp.]
MTRKVQSPIYVQIALDFAYRIVRGELKENSKVSGRSTLSSEYGVSPETIRRAMSLLEQSKVVRVVEQSGIFIEPKAHALHYLQQASFVNSVEVLKANLRDAFKRKAEIEDEIQSIVREILDLSSRFKNIDLLNRFEVEITGESPLLNESLKSSKFYQHTMATVIAIQRDKQLIASPSPTLQFEENDVLIVVGPLESFDLVEAFVGSKNNIKG